MRSLFAFPELLLPGQISQEFILGSCRKRLQVLFEPTLERGQTEIFDFFIGRGNPGSMFLNSSLACVTTHVLARVITHVLARALLHVLAQSSGQFELACVATHVLARVATHMLGHVSIPITYLHCHQGHWCGQTRGRP